MIMVMVAVVVLEMMMVMIMMMIMKLNVFYTDCITLHSNRLIKTKAVSEGVCPASVAPYK
jgi:hypothetical protein